MAVCHLLVLYVHELTWNTYSPRVMCGGRTVRTEGTEGRMSGGAVRVVMWSRLNLCGVFVLVLAL